MDIFDLLKSRKEENIKIYKNLFSEIKKQLKDNDNKIIIANFIAFIFYLISLIGCEKGEENLCVTDFIVEFILEGVIVMLNGLLISIEIFLMFFKKIKWYHLIYIFLFYALIDQYNYEYTLKQHGGYNKLFLIFFTLLFLIIELMIYLLYKLYIKNIK